jgi:hypothetical protein
MQPKLLLRIASMAILIHVLGHMMGHSGWKTPKDPGQQEVVKQMLEHKAPFMGAVHSMGDYYEGFSLCMTAVLLMMLLLTWTMSGTAVDHPSITSKVLIPISCCMIAFAAIEFVYFFAFAASISLIAGTLVGIAALRLKGANAA